MIRNLMMNTSQKKIQGLRMNHQTIIRQKKIQDLRMNQLKKILIEPKRIYEFQREESSPLSHIYHGSTCWHTLDKGRGISPSCEFIFRRPSQYNRKATQSHPQCNQDAVRTHHVKLHIGRQIRNRCESPNGNPDSESWSSNL